MGNKFINYDIIINEFISHVNRQYSVASFEEIWICTEMHNFILFDIDSETYSDFYSWRHSTRESNSFKNKLLKIKKKHHKESGQSLYKGIPLLNFYGKYKKKSIYKILSLPELIVHKYGKSSNKLHDTMAASSGCLNIQNNKWLNKYLSFLYTDFKYFFANIFKENEIPLLGEIKVNKKIIKIIGGFGDLQTALYGRNIHEKEICINIGTGSQVIALCDDKDIYSSEYDIKPFFGKFIKAITHIPAGRSLNFINHEICKSKDFWVNLSNVKKTLPSNFFPEFDLNIFESNWRYNKDNKEKIIKCFKNDKNFYELILKAFCLEYFLAIKKIDPEKKYKKIILSGGKLKEINYVKNFFKNINGYCLEHDKNDLDVDETLIGLNKLTKLFS
jgi:sugar (pentulose or hexulose) kinase